MRGRGTFFDRRLSRSAQFPIAAKAGFANQRNTPDLITSRLAALSLLSTRHPRADASSANLRQGTGGSRSGRLRGQGTMRHLSRTATFRRTRLADARGCRDHQRRVPGGPVTGQAVPDDAAPWALHANEGRLLSDGRFANLKAVVDHYDRFLKLTLTQQEKAELIEFPKSLLRIERL